MTIAGSHTIQEVADLRRLLEWRTQRINAALKALDVAQVAAGDASLAADWDAYLDRWVSARNAVIVHATAEASAARAAGNVVPGATSVLGFVSDDLIPDEDDYQALLHASSATYPAYTSKDLAGLQQRVEKFGPINFDLASMPTGRDFDFDLAAYRAATAVEKGIEKAKDAAQKTLGELLWENKGAVALGVAVLLGYGIMTSRGRS